MSAGVSRLTILVIQSNDIEFCPITSDGKWGCMITHTIGKNYRPIVTINPFYKTKDDALTAAKNMVDKIKKIKVGLFPPRKDD